MRRRASVPSTHIGAHLRDSVSGSISDINRTFVPSAFKAGDRDLWSAEYVDFRVGLECAVEEVHCEGDDIYIYKRTHVSILAIYTYPARALRVVQAVCTHTLTEPRSRSHQ